MTAGSGVVHSEMPSDEILEKGGKIHGFQLWVNLPAAEKMTPPAYQEFDAVHLPKEKREDGVEVIAIAGTTSQGTVGAVRERPTEPIYFDVRIPEGNRFTEAVPTTHSGFIFVIEGSVGVSSNADDETLVAAGKLAILGDGDTIQLTGKEASNRLLLIAGRSLNEPVARGGPFVMNTPDEIRQAFNDYQSGNFV